MAVPGIRVSVVVPVFNGEAFLERTARSLIGQSLGSDAYQIIYVDDGSTDASAEILRRLASTHPHVLVHRQENSGLAGETPQRRH